MLGNNKGDDHFPQILAENPDAGSVCGSFFQIIILFIDGRENGAVIRVQIKIRFPIGKLFFRAEKGNFFSLLNELQIVGFADDLIGRRHAGGGSALLQRRTDFVMAGFGFPQRQHPETLSGIGNLI